MSSDTIYALASAPGRAGVAVVRVSGPQSWAGLENLTGRLSYDSRMSALVKLKNPVGQILDEALVLPFKGPGSYTGEDVVEYHLHGGRAVIDSVLAELAKQPGHRLAEPGEFTRRAFENGKMDLTAAEAVADLIDAETQAQRIQALGQMGGALSSLYMDWTERLKRALAHLEADIEFPDEDMPEGVAPEVLEAIELLISEISDHLNDNRRGERLRDGIQVAIIGAPNAGKSSLVNALAQRDVAIVSEAAGTTRDVIEVHLDLGGYPVILADTAGLRPEDLGETAQDQVESEGIRRALKRAEEADITILMFDGTAAEVDAHTLNLIDDRSILVVNKADDVFCKAQVDAAISISVKTGSGINDLLRALEQKIKNDYVSRETISLTRQRHRSALEESLNALGRSLSADLPELAAEDIRLSVRAIGRITGRVDVEDLLDVIFKDFCIGK